MSRHHRTGKAVLQDLDGLPAQLFAPLRGAERSREVFDNLRTLFLGAPLKLRDLAHSGQSVLEHNHACAQFIALSEDSDNFVSVG
jgi:hypothetical protein